MKTNTKTLSNKQEKQVALDLKGKTTIASGALDIQKADVRTDDWLIECKTTAKSYYPLKVSTWLKIQKEALKDGLRTPLMCIELNNKSTFDKVSIAVLNYFDFKGYEFDKGHTFVGSITPEFNYNNSYRVTTDILQKSNEMTENLLANSNYMCIHFVKFLEAKEPVELVFLLYDDFLLLEKERQALLNGGNE